MKKKFDILKTKLCILVDSNDLTRLVKVENVEKEKFPGTDFFFHTLHGSVPVFEGEHASICSNADVTIEFRSIPKICGKSCCDL